MPFNPNTASEPCPICRSASNNMSSSAWGRVTCCVRCGDFIPTRELRDDWPQHGGKNPKKVALACYIIRQLQSGTSPPRLDLATLEELLEQNPHLPSPPEVTSNLLRLIGDSLRDSPASHFKANLLTLSAQIGTVNEQDVN